MELIPDLPVSDYIAWMSRKSVKDHLGISDRYLRTFQSAASDLVASKCFPDDLKCWWDYEPNDELFSFNSFCFVWAYRHLVKSLKKSEKATVIMAKEFRKWLKQQGLVEE